MNHSVSNQPSLGDLDSRLIDTARAVDITFTNYDLLRLALTHRSYLNELDLKSDEVAVESNERLEFLGDALLGVITADFLYHHFPDLPEGELTSYRTALVRTETLANWARRFNLDRNLFLGRGETLNEGQVRDRILAGAFEAMIAAIYLDQGLDICRAFLQRLLEEDAEAVISEGRETNYKGRLQELFQDRERVTPAYRTVTVSGPAHDRRFEVEVLAGSRRIGVGRGTSKRMAQQDAARQALSKLALSEDESGDE